MAGELTPDNGYALLQNTTPDMAMLRRNLLARRALAQRNSAAMQPPPQMAGAGSTTPDAVRARALGDYNRFGNGGVVLNQPPVAQPDPGADTPEDAARKAAMSRMKLSSYNNAGRAGSGEVSGGGVDDWQARRALQAKLSANATQRTGGLTRREQSDLARANVESGAAAQNRQQALADFNKRNAERAYKRGTLTPGAYKLAVNKGNLPSAPNSNGTQVGHLESIYGQGNVPPEAYNAAMREDGETARRMHEAPDKAAMAKYMQHKMLTDAFTTLGPDHPVTKSLMKEFGIEQSQPALPPAAGPPANGVGQGDESPPIPPLPPAPTARTKRGKVVYGNPYGPS